MTGARSKTGSGKPHGYAIFVLPALTMGGMEKQLMTILEADPEALSRHQIEILTVLPTVNDIILRRLQDLDVRVHTIDRSSMRFPEFFLRLVRYFRQQRPDIVHAFLAGSTGTWGRLAARLAGVKHVVFSDRQFAPIMTPAQRLVDPLVTRLTSRFVANAQATVDRLQRHGAPPARIVLVRNGVDTDRYAAVEPGSMRASWGVPANAVVAGFLGMFRPMKRPELFLQAILALRPSDRPDYVVMAGDGAQMPLIRRMVQEDAWLTERCRLLGVVEDTPAFLGSIDFLVQTSDSEGLPNAILEAMAAGIPCIGTSVSDVPFLIGDDRFLPPAGDAQRIADAIRRMRLLAAEERSGIGDALRARAEQEFGVVRAARAFWAVHDDLWPTGVGG
jgi:glycosyltransferase involved in cell wall biosynthesis